MASGIEVSVEWETPTVFAGEELRCIITFKNTSKAPAPITTASNYNHRGLASARERWKKDLPSPSPTIASHNGHDSGASQTRHRPTLSLSTPANTANSFSLFADSPASGNPSTDRHSHKRSISIISLGSQTGQSEGSGTATKNSDVRVPRNTHGRSTSLHGLPFRKSSAPVSLSSPLATAPPVAAHGQRSSTVPLAAKGASTLHSEDSRSKLPLERGQLPRSGSIFQKAPPWKHIRSGSEMAGIESRVPLNSNQALKADRPSLQRQASQRAARSINSTVSEGPSHRSLQRVLAPASTEGTPRSSMDIYTRSNASSETMQSEYLMPNATGLLDRSTIGESGNYLHNGNTSGSKAETLMMGYVHLNGSFILDGSLVNLGPFEMVKRKAIIGGQASGGVVGLGKSNKENGLLSSFGWSSIGSSIGTLLGSEEPSSIREMKGMANTRSIPILSTAQSILFVDLKLQPGERRSFSYSYHLPFGIPPSFRGRAFKSSYSLVVGTQRSMGAKKQHMVSKVDVPFKVLPSISETGDALGHDLMNPHIILTDLSTSRPVDYSSETATRNGKRPVPLRQAADGFKDYVDLLLADSRDERSGGLLSPTAAVPRSNLNFEEPSEKLTMKQLIDMAIATQRTKASERASYTTFQIGRPGSSVAKVFLNRAGFRLGETVTGSIDFQDAEIPCYTVNAFLEASETVDQAIAIRSVTSIHRMTRKVHAKMSMDTTWAEKTTFSLTIPPAATPEFITSGVSLEWKIRLEFIIGGGQAGKGEEQLLEELDEDERGTVLVGVQELPCHAFEALISIRVYGSTNELPDTETTSSHLI